MSLYADDQFIHLVPSINFDEQKQFREGTSGGGIDRLLRQALRYENLVKRQHAAYPQRGNPWHESEKSRSPTSAASSGWPGARRQCINCLIGPGDSGKSTVLDAIDLCLGARRNVQFSDADFFGLDITNPISITLTLGDLDDAMRDAGELRRVPAGLSLHHRRRRRRTGGRRGGRALPEPDRRE
jgi:hypothetical protein